MSILRSIGAGISRSLMITFIIAFIFTLGVSQLDLGGVVSGVLDSTLDKQFGENDDALKDFYEELNKTCESSGKEKVDLPLDEGLTLEFNCKEVSEGGKEKILDSFKEQVSKKFFGDEKIEVNCKGYDCITQIKNSKDPKEAIAIITSKSFDDFISLIAKMFLLLAIIFGGIVILLSEGITGRILGVSYPLAIAGLPYFGINFVKSYLQDSIPESASIILKNFINSLTNNFLAVLILGIVLMVIGFVLKFVFKIGKITKKVVTR